MRKTDSIWRDAVLQNDAQHQRALAISSGKHCYDALDDARRNAQRFARRGAGRSNRPWTAL